jgi:peptidoglycan/xylan/chitin deacetylase (PgdA/CDA1 family)
LIDLRKLKRRVKNVGERLSRQWLGAITHVQTSHPVVALTFDDGPHPLHTPQLLRILHKHGAKATFFVVGEAASKHPELVKMTAEAGHSVGNHSWDHPPFPSLKTRRQRREQIRACSTAIAPYGSRLFRPPFGANNLAVEMDAYSLGYKTVMWNLSLTDWLPLQPEELAARMIESIRPGTIVLLHDAIFCSRVSGTQQDRAPMLEGLDMALTEIGNRFRFVTVPDLLRCGHAMRKID